MEKLKTLELLFLRDYPQGFDTEELKEVGKKHNIEKLADFVNENFTKACFKDERHILDAYQKLISRSSMVSRFEKPAFKRFIESIGDDQADLIFSLYELIHGDEAKGFDALVAVLRPHKLAKWPVVSALLAYLRPQEEVFIKPTTVKNILNYFEITDFKYNAKPTYDFYRQYRQFINELKADVPSVLKPNNPAFSGFLMMTLEG